MKTFGAITIFIFFIIWTMIAIENKSQMYDTRRVYIFFGVLYCNSNIFIRYTRMCWAKLLWVIRIHYVAPICVIYTGLYISYFYWASEGFVKN